MVNYEPFQFYRLADDFEECHECGEDAELCDCRDDDEEWRENAESEIAAAENLEEK